MNCYEVTQQFVILVFMDKIAIYKIHCVCYVPFPIYCKSIIIFFIFAFIREMVIEVQVIDYNYITILKELSGNNL